ncbi:MAG: 2-dehydropantoate 2-reductase [Dehalococcoidia bacterium]|nr:2-dehydropantoate 2-reductase [Dehalococcoidia bacterium]
MKKAQRVAVIGAGAVGSYYGGRLAEAGHDVRFLVRRDYHAVRSSGLNVTSPDGDFLLEHPLVASDSAEIGTADWVICALKSTSIHAAHKLVQPCVRADTRILVLMNGLGLEDHFAGWFGAERIFGGLAFTCINRGKPGHVHHLAYGTVTLGHYKNDPAEIVKALELWSGSKTSVVPASSLLKARWEKLCWNIPFSGLCVAGGGITTDRIMSDTSLRAAAKALMEEVICAGNADLALHGEKACIDRDTIINSLFQKTSTMGAYRPSTMIDFVEGKSMEIDAIFAEPLRRARELKVPTHGLALLTALLKSLNQGR